MDKKYEVSIELVDDDSCNDRNRFDIETFLTILLKPYFKKIEDITVEESHEN